jgi:hypothetical protein
MVPSATPSQLGRPGRETLLRLAINSMCGTMQTTTKSVAIWNT